MGISSLNKSTNIVSTVHAIFAQISSIGAEITKKLIPVALSFKNHPQ
jgi:hypothetical protein